MKRTVFVVVLAALLIATTGTTRAETTRIYFTGHTNCEPKVTVIREWMAGPIYQARGFSGACNDKASIPQMNGVEYIQWRVVGANIILSGTDRMETKEGGVWAGSWEWPANTWIIKIVMQGEGIYAGQQLRMFEDASNDTFWGYIEVTGN
jgi:hypothetical protein